MIKLPAGFDFAPILQFGSARPYDITSPTDNLGFGNGSANYGVLVPVANQKDYTYSLTSGLTKAQLREAYFEGKLTTASSILCAAIQPLTWTPAWPRTSSCGRRASIFS